MGIVLVPAFFIYISFSAFIFWQVKKRAKSKKITWGTALILFLIPTWDIIVTIFIYIPMVVLNSGETIHKKIQTNSIYYDVFYKKKGVLSKYTESYFSSGFDFIEMDVLETYPVSAVPEEGLYRFWVDEKKLKFKKINELRSEFTINENEPQEMKFFPIKIRTRQIIQRNTNKVIASASDVEIYYLSVFGLPFFNWLNWYDMYSYINSNPSYRFLEQKVINAKNRRSK